MKRATVVLLCWLLTGCGYASHHPVRTKLAIIGAGAAAGVGIALALRKTCPSRINGYPYDGTPPCPNPATYWPSGARH